MFSTFSELKKQKKKKNITGALHIRSQKEKHLLTLCHHTKKSPQKKTRWSRLSFGKKKFLPNIPSGKTKANLAFFMLHMPPFRFFVEKRRKSQRNGERLKKRTAYVC
jgi:hypothetical protein